MREIGLLQVFVLAAGITLGAANQDITVCDLVNHAEAFDGKTVRLRGRIAFTMHGIAVLGESCKNSPQGVAVLTPGGDHSPQVDFSLDSQASERLAPFIRSTGGGAIACGVLGGRLFHKKGFRLRQEGAGPQGNGFGSRGVLPWALVLQSVVEIRPCE